MAFSSILVQKHHRSASGGTPVRFRKILYAGLIAAVSVLAVHWVAKEWRPSARAEFVRASRGERPVEGRLSWGFSYAPYKAGPGVAPEPQGPRNLSFRGGSWSSKAESALVLEAGE